jgi:hypothetical protein
MTTQEKYQGWTNYETWNVKLWLDNDEGSYHWLGDLAQTAWDNAEIEEQNPLADQATMWSDLLSAALSEVNWMEIAGSVLEDVDKEEETDDDTDDEETAKESDDFDA